MNRNRFLLLIFVGAFIFNQTAFAEVVRIRQTGYASLTGDEKSCYQSAIKSARDTSVKIILKKIAKGANSESLEEALKNADDAVRGVKVLSRKVMGDGRCRIEVRLKIDKIKLASLVDKSVVAALEEKPKLSVGTVIRFIIDGKIADDVGGDTQYALVKLGQELQRYSIEVVNLDPLVTKYARKQSREWEKVALAEGEKASGQKRVDSSGAITQLVNAVEEVWDFAPEKLRKFDAVAVGQVHVRALGRDPQGPGYLAEVATYIKLLRLGKKRGTEIGGAVIPGTVDGQTQEGANIQAMLLSVENSVSVIAERLAK